MFWILENFEIGNHVQEAANKGHDFESCGFRNFMFVMHVVHCPTIACGNQSDSNRSTALTFAFRGLERSSGSNLHGLIEW